MLLVDLTIVQVALPRIQIDLHASFTNLQWVIDAYALTMSALILTSGALADRVGRKRVFLSGVTVFTLASLACGLSSSATMLIAARAVQGFGGAAMFATSLALIAQEFQGRERGVAIAAWGATVGGAVAVGPLVGGILTDGLGWQWIFFVNLPIGIATIAMSSTRLVNVRDPDAERLDWAGLVTFSGALFLLIFALLRGSDEGWGSTLIVSMLAGAAILLGAFLAVEMRQRRPMLDLTLFSNRAFCGVSLATFLIGAGMFAMFPYLTLYLQDALGYSPLAGRPAAAAGDGADVRRAAGHAPHDQPYGAGPAARRGPGTDRAGDRPDERTEHELELDGALAGSPADGRRDRPGQPRDREHRAGRRASRAQRHGLGHQQHLPRGRPRDRRGGAGGAVPAPHRHEPAGLARRTRTGAREGRGLGRHARRGSCRAHTCRTYSRWPCARSPTR